MRDYPQTTKGAWLQTPWVRRMVQPVFRSDEPRLRIGGAAPDPPHGAGHGRICGAGGMHGGALRSNADRVPAGRGPGGALLAGATPSRRDPAGDYRGPETDRRPLPR